MMRDYKRNVEYIVDEKGKQEEVEGKSSFAYFSKRVFDVEQFLNSALVDDHLGNIFIIILFGNIKG